MEGDVDLVAPFEKSSGCPGLPPGYRSGGMREKQAWVNLDTL